MSHFHLSPADDMIADIAELQPLNQVPVTGHKNRKQLTLTKHLMELGIEPDFGFCQIKGTVVAGKKFRVFR